MADARGGGAELRLCLAGDTMLGRGVARAIRASEQPRLISDEVVASMRSADLRIFNLECCISARGERWPAPGKPFFFRAPPEAAGLLAELGVNCVTLANNHALDYGYDALTDTLTALEDAGITCVGAGSNFEEATAPGLLQRAGRRIAVLGLTDHPTDFAASEDRAGVAYADLKRGVPRWVTDRMESCDADVLVVTPHWGPNMTTDPPAHVRIAARQLVDSGATLVAGHSAHVFHGVARRILFDLGDFIDDYATDPWLRNDLGLLWFVTLGTSGVTRVEAVPLKLDFAYTSLAEGDDLQWIRTRFRSACAALGTTVEVLPDRLVALPA
jgi:poly-gamma-glutamate capsule biosynthesis protein CapA/YwtB (metallophosphatase superfamily)